MFTCLLQSIVAMSRDKRHSVSMNGARLPSNGPRTICLYRSQNLVSTLVHCLKSGLVVTVYSAHHSGLSIGIAIATVGRRLVPPTEEMNSQVATASFRKSIFTCMLMNE